MTILIVDDDPVQCRLLEGMLQKFGYETVTRDNGDAALALLCQPDGGRIDGVIHCAGVIEDDFIIRKSHRSFARVLAPKVAGTENLDRATRDLRRQEVRGDHREIGRRNHPAIEGADRHRDPERLKQHAQAAGRPLGRARPHVFRWNLTLPLGSRCTS